MFFYDVNICYKPINIINDSNKIGKYEYEYAISQTMKAVKLKAILVHLILFWRTFFAQFI